MSATAVWTLCLVAAITIMSSLTTPGTGFSPLACFAAMTKFLALETGLSGQIDVIYTDFAKAFDTVLHQRQLLKIKTYNMDKDLVLWITDFLRNRKQCVVLNGEVVMVQRDKWYITRYYIRTFVIFNIKSGLNSGFSD